MTKYGDGVTDRIEAAAPGGIDALIDTHGGGCVELALALGVTAERIDTIADFAAPQSSEPELGDGIIFQRIRGADVVVHGPRIRPPALAHDFAVAGTAEGGLGGETGA
jgi:hypothetical protein